jgi:hypothetical protein
MKKESGNKNENDRVIEMKMKGTSDNVGRPRCDQPVGIGWITLGGKYLYEDLRWIAEKACQEGLRQRLG